MNIKSAQFAKPKITELSYSKKKLCSFSTYNKKLHKLITKTEKYQDENDMFVTTLETKSGKFLGKDVFSIPTAPNPMFDYNILAHPQFRNKNFNIGEILRLSSIIELIENNLPQINLCSKDTSIYFHAKYKFEPNITQFTETSRALESIINNPSNNVEMLISKAKTLIQKFNNSTSPEEKRAIRTSANILIKDYIETVLAKNNYKQHPFNYTMDMKLTIEKIKENKHFFNALFRKHKINYQI